MGAAGFGKRERFFCQGERALFVKVIAVTDCQVAAQGRGPSAGYVFSCIAQFQNFPHCFGV